MAVEGKVDSLTEVLIQHSFFSWSFLLFTCFRSFIIWLTIYVKGEVIATWVLWAISDFISVLFQCWSKVWATWEETSCRIGTRRETTDQGFLIRTIVVSQFNLFDFYLFFIPVIWIFLVFNQRFRSQGLQDIRTIVENSRWSNCSIIFTWRLQKLFIYR